MNEGIDALLSWQQPIIWTVTSLLVYVLSLKVFRLLGRRSVFHPLLLCMGMLWLILYLAEQDISAYRQNVALLQWLLGPATVALAVPLFKQIAVIKRQGPRVLSPILIGAIVAPLSAVVWLYWAEMETALQVTMLSKSITTPLAMDTADFLGGYPELAAVIVILTGITGAISCPLLFRLFSIHSPEAQGLALGTVAHAVGTAQALQISEKAGAYATLALCVNGVLTAILLPLLFYVFT